MSHWNAGYVTEIDYTSQYFNYLSPAHLRFAMLTAGFEAPEQNDDFNYLEIGFGQGVSLAAHACSNPGTFWGMDFIPSQTAFCQDLLRGTGANAHILNDSFQEFLERRDVPQFDMIGIHGIMSWVSAENREAIAEILRRHLKPGGLVYVSYNTYPGWSSMAPVREFIMETHRRRGNGSVAHGMQAGLDQMQRLMEVGSPYLKANPVIAQRLKMMDEQDKSYLAHEYLNEAWKTFYFSEMSELMDTARLTYATSAHLMDHFDGLNMSADAAKLLTGETDPVLREMTRDLLCNTMFRRDIFVKGRRAMTPLKRHRVMNDQQFVLQHVAQSIPTTFDAPAGKVSLESPVYEMLKTELARDDMSPKSFGDLVAVADRVKIPRSQVYEGIRILVARNHVRPAQSADTIRKSSKSARLFNENVTRMAADSETVDVVTSPVMGVAMRLGNLNLQLLHTHLVKSKTPEEDLWRTLQLKGEKLMDGDRVLETKEEHMLALGNATIKFRNELLPMLKMLKIA